MIVDNYHQKLNKGVALRVVGQLRTQALRK